MIIIQICNVDGQLRDGIACRERASYTRVSVRVLYAYMCISGRLKEYKCNGYPIVCRTCTYII